MNGQNQEFDPKDLNKDGKVSVEEVLKSAAGAVVEGAEEVVDQVKAYLDLSPGERKVRDAELKEKASNLADQAAAAAKEIFGEMKDNAEKLFKKGE